MRKIILGIFLTLLSMLTVNLPANPAPCNDSMQTRDLAHELKIGILYHDIAQVWGNTKIEGGYDVSAEFQLGSGFLRHGIGVSVNSKGQTSRVYYSLVPRLVLNRPLCVSFALGVAYQWDAVRKLGSPILFRVAGEIGYRFGPHSISIILDHISNANLAEHNAGLDLFGIRYGWRW